MNIKDNSKSRPQPLASVYRLGHALDEGNGTDLLSRTALSSLLQQHANDVSFYEKEIESLIRQGVDINACVEFGENNISAPLIEHAIVQKNVELTKALFNLGPEKLKLCKPNTDYPWAFDSITHLIVNHPEAMSSEDFFCRTREISRVILEQKPVFDKYAKDNNLDQGRYSLNITHDSRNKDGRASLNLLIEQMKNFNLDIDSNVSLKENVVNTIGHLIKMGENPNLSSNDENVDVLSQVVNYYPQLLATFIDNGTDIDIPVYVGEIFVDLNDAVLLKIIEGDSVYNNAMDVLPFSLLEKVAANDDFLKFNLEYVIAEYDALQTANMNVFEHRMSHNHFYSDYNIRLMNCIKCCDLKNSILKKVYDISKNSVQFCDSNFKVLLKTIKHVLLNKVKAKEGLLASEYKKAQSGFNALKLHLSNSNLEFIRDLVPLETDIEKIKEQYRSVCSLFEKKEGQLLYQNEQLWREILHGNAFSRKNKCIESFINDNDLMKLDVAILYSRFLQNVKELADYRNESLSEKENIISNFNILSVNFDHLSKMMKSPDGDSLSNCRKMLQHLNDAIEGWTQQGRFSDSPDKLKTHEKELSKLVAKKESNEEVKSEQVLEHVVPIAALEEPKPDISKGAIPKGIRKSNKQQKIDISPEPEAISSTQLQKDKNEEADAVVGSEKDIGRDKDAFSEIQARQLIINTFTWGASRSRPCSVYGVEGVDSIKSTAISSSLILAAQKESLAESNQTKKLKHLITELESIVEKEGQIDKCKVARQELIDSYKTVDNVKALVRQVKEYFEIMENDDLSDSQSANNKNKLSDIKTKINEQISHSFITDLGNSLTAEIRTRESKEFVLQMNSYVQKLIAGLIHHDLCDVDYITSLLTSPVFRENKNYLNLYLEKMIYSDVPQHSFGELISVIAKKIPASELQKLKQHLFNKRLYKDNKSIFGAPNPRLDIYSFLTEIIEGEQSEIQDKKKETFSYLECLNLVPPSSVFRDIISKKRGEKIKKAIAESHTANREETLKILSQSLKEEFFAKSLNETSEFLKRTDFHQLLIKDAVNISDYEKKTFKYNIKQRIQREIIEQIKEQWKQSVKKYQTELLSFALALSTVDPIRADAMTEVAYMMSGRFKVPKSLLSPYIDSVMGSNEIKYFVTAAVENRCKDYLLEHQRATKVKMTVREDVVNIMPLSTDSELSNLQLKDQDKLSQSIRSKLADQTALSSASAYQTEDSGFVREQLSEQFVVSVSRGKQKETQVAECVEKTVEQVRGKIEPEIKKKEMTLEDEARAEVESLFVFTESDTSKIREEAQAGFFSNQEEKQFKKEIAAEEFRERRETAISAAVEMIIEEQASRDILQCFKEPSQTQQREIERRSEKTIKYIEDSLQKELKRTNKLFSINEETSKQFIRRKIEEELSKDNLEKESNDVAKETLDKEVAQKEAEKRGLNRSKAQEQSTNDVDSDNELKEKLPSVPEDDIGDYNAEKREKKRAQAEPAS